MPPALTPNDPRKRFEHVLKSFWSKSYKGESLNGAVLDTFYVTTSLLGAHLVHLPDRIVSHEPGTLGVKYKTDEILVERIQMALEGPTDSRGQPLDVRGAHPESEGARRHRWATESKTMLARVGQSYEYNARNEILWDGEQWALADVVVQVVKLPEHSPPDFLIPWIARELVKLAKAVIDGGPRSSRRTGALSTVERLREAGVSHSDYWDAVHALYDKAPAIAQWAKETRTDIGKVDLSTALEAIATYKFKESLVEQGTVVYRYKDDWTVQELRTETALSQEGKDMQNCVGSYCEDVERGDTRIYSVRDASGQPHVSMELAVPKGPSNYGSELKPEEFIRSEKRLRWHFAQVLGKQNDMPTDEYRDRAREFVDKVFDKEGFGWCITGGTVKSARFAGRQLISIDFVEILHVNHIDGDSFAGANFFEADLRASKFGALPLNGVSFEKANLSEADFTSAALDRAKFDGALCYFTRFRGASLQSASFDSAHVGGANFENTNLLETNFRAAQVDGAHFEDSKNGISANWEGVTLTGRQKKELRLELKGSIGEGRTAG